MTNRIRTRIATLVLALSLTGIGFGQGGTATVLQGVDPGTLDPALFASTTQQTIFTHIFDTLTELDWETGELVGNLATSWEIVDDVTWRFFLREDVTFQNGEHFDAHVMQYNLARLVDPEIGAYDWFFVADADFESSRVIDDYTIEITTEQPSALVAELLRFVFVVPQGYYSTTPLTTLASQPIGSGPYQLTSWTRDDAIVLERWNEYWGDSPSIERIVVRSVPESSTRIAELVTGGADLVVNVPPDQTLLIDRDPNSEVRSVESGRVIHVMIDNSVEPFGDLRARLALNYAVNKQAIIDNLFLGLGTPLAGIANGPWRNTNIEPYTFDPELALDLFSQVGYTQDAEGVLRNADGEAIVVTIDTPVGRYLKDAEVAQAVRDDLRRIGLVIDVQTLEWSVRTQQQRSGTSAALSLSGLGGLFNGVGEMRWVTPTPQYSDRDREIRWQSAEFEELYADMRATLNDTERKAKVDQLQELAMEGAPWIFLYRQYDNYGVSNRLTDWQPRPDEVLDLRDVELQ